MEGISDMSRDASDEEGLLRVSTPKAWHSAALNLWHENSG